MDDVAEAGVIMSRCRLDRLLVGWMVLTLSALTVMADDDAATSADAFLSRHWLRPLQHQGEPPPPEHFSALEASLDPSACGACHQFDPDGYALNGLYLISAGDPARPGRLTAVETDNTPTHSIQLLPSALSCKIPAVL